MRIYFILMFLLTGTLTVFGVIQGEETGNLIYTGGMALVFLLAFLLRMHLKNKKKAGNK